MFFKKYKNQFCLLIGVVVILAGCRNEVSVEEFAREVSKDKDFIRVVADSTFKITCTYKPTELMALTELRGRLSEQQSLDKALLDSTSKIFSNSAYFTLQIALQDGSDILQRGISNRQEYVLLVNELTYNMRRDFYMLTKQNDTIYSTAFDFQRTYGMSPVATLLFVFPSEAIKDNKKFRLVYIDRFFGIPGPVKFEFDSDDLTKRLPEIKEIKK